MSDTVLILSPDAVFARMLVAEFAFSGISARASAAIAPGERAEVLILDLDSGILPDPECFSFIFGFTRAFTLSPGRVPLPCRMLLHRPFEVSILKREVLSVLEGGVAGAEPYTERPYDGERINLRLDADTRIFHVGERKIPLTPREMALTEQLLSHRGSPVSRRDLALAIGESVGNKVDVYVCLLRKKTDRKDGAHLIRTVRKEGYMIP